MSKSPHSVNWTVRYQLMRTKVIQLVHSLLLSLVIGDEDEDEHVDVKIDSADAALLVPVQADVIKFAVAAAVVVAVELSHMVKQSSQRLIQLN